MLILRKRCRPFVLSVTDGPDKYFLSHFSTCRLVQDAKEAGEDDIEAILADILKKEELKTAVSINATVFKSGFDKQRVTCTPG